MRLYDSHCDDDTKPARSSREINGELAKIHERYIIRAFRARLRQCRLPRGNYFRISLYSHANAPAAGTRSGTHAEVERELRYIESSSVNSPSSRRHDECANETRGFTGRREIQYRPIHHSARFILFVHDTVRNFNSISYRLIEAVRQRGGGPGPSCESELSGSRIRSRSLRVIFSFLLFLFFFSSFLFSSPVTTRARESGYYFKGGARATERSCAV